MRNTERAYAMGVRLGVGEIASEITTMADELVPFAEGTLHGSQETNPKVTGTVLEVEIAYGGPAAPYALVQHENVHLSHPPKSQGGSPVAPGQGRGPKYLEYPTKLVAKRAEKIIADSIERAGG